MCVWQSRWHRAKPAAFRVAGFSAGAHWRSQLGARETGETNSSTFPRHHVWCGRDCVQSFNPSQIAALFRIIKRKINRLHRPVIYRDP